MFHLKGSERTKVTQISVPKIVVHKLQIDDNGEDLATPPRPARKGKGKSQNTTETPDKSKPTRGNQRRGSGKSATEDDTGENVQFYTNYYVHSW